MLDIEKVGFTTIKEDEHNTGFKDVATEETSLESTNVAKCKEGFPIALLMFSWTDTNCTATRHQAILQCILYRMAINNKLNFDLK